MRVHGITACAFLAYALSLLLTCSAANAAGSTERFTSRYDLQIRSAVSRYWQSGTDWRLWKAQLYQESRLDPSAVSPVGAVGLAQFMPATWSDICRRLGINGASPHETRYAILAGAYYMRTLQDGWSSPRPWKDRLKLAQASYNAGMGSLMKAQKLCGNPSLYNEIVPCLPQITGEYSRETITYVERIERWHKEMSR